MRLYIWEGNGISEAYHDDGTLVVLADSPEQARQIVRRGLAALRRRRSTFEAARRARIDRLDAAGIDRRTHDWDADEEWQTIARTEPPYESGYFDGSDAALDRDPDRILPITKPAWVAFNGGGYD